MAANTRGVCPQGMNQFHDSKASLGHEALNMRQYPKTVGLGFKKYQNVLFYFEVSFGEIHI